MQVLASAHVLSAPLVLRTSASEADKYMVLGFLSVGDFVRAFVERAERVVQFDTPLLTRMRALSALGADFCASGVITLHTSDDGEMVFRGATEAMSLLELIRSGFLRMPFRRPPLPARHRVGVFDERGRLADIVSMSNMVVWALQHFDRLGALPTRTLAELGLTGAEASDAPAREEVVCVPTTMPTHVAFGTAVHRGVSAVGVTDPASGALVANLSQSDFRAFVAHDFGSMALPVGEYLVHRHNLSVPADDEATGERADPAPGSAAGGIRDPWARALHAARVVVSLRPEDTFLRLLEALVAARVHRVYVSNDQLAPLAVISHTDVLAVLLRGHKPAP
jgi:CBS domain-containing protein